MLLKIPEVTTEVTEMNSRTRISTLLVVCLVLPFLAFAATSLPAGTTIKDAKVGQGVVATVSRDVTENGRMVIPKGAHAKLVVSSVQASGRLSTPAKLYLRLKSVEVHGKTIDIGTSSAGRTLGGKGKRDAGFIGGGAGAGALIGGLAGGGKRQGCRDRRGRGSGSRNCRRRCHRQERHRLPSGNALDVHNPRRRDHRLIWKRFSTRQAVSVPLCLFSCHG